MYVVISGGGKIGSYLASVLLKDHHEVAIIEEDIKTADTLSVSLTGNCLIIHGDGCDSKAQEDAGIRRADVFVATTGQDDDNLVSCEIAQRIFRVERCIARVNSPKNERIFRKIGIECVSSTSIIADLIEEEAMLGSVSAVSTLSHGNVILNEFSIPRMKRHNNEEGVIAWDIELPNDALIAAAIISGEVCVADENTCLHPGDKAIVIADTSALDDVRSAFRAL